MRRTTSPSSGKPYGIARVCRTAWVARATVYRHLGPAQSAPPPRPGPSGPMPDPALVAAIRRVLRHSPLHGEGHRKVRARLRLAGIRTSGRRVLRPMRENVLLAPSRLGSPRGPQAHQGTIIPVAIDLVWGTDTTTAYTKQGPVTVFVAVDHHSAQSVDIHVATRATPFAALEPLRRGIRRHVGGFAEDIARRLGLRHDPGRQYVAGDVRKELRLLAIAGSPTFLRAPDGKGCAERSIRILEENRLWAHSSDSIEDQHPELLEFPDTYNSTWLIERYGFQPPATIGAKQLQPTAHAEYHPNRCLPNRRRFSAETSASCAAQRPRRYRPFRFPCRKPKLGSETGRR